MQSGCLAKSRQLGENFIICSLGFLLAVIFCFFLQYLNQPYQSDLGRLLFIDTCSAHRWITFRVSFAIVGGFFLIFWMFFIVFKEKLFTLNIAKKRFSSMVGLFVALLTSISVIYIMVNTERYLAAFSTPPETGVLRSWYWFAVLLPLAVLITSFNKNDVSGDKTAVVGISGSAVTLVYCVWAFFIPITGVDDFDPILGRLFSLLK